MGSNATNGKRCKMGGRIYFPTNLLGDKPAWKRPGPIHAQFYEEVSQHKNSEGSRETESE